MKKLLPFLLLFFLLIAGACNQQTSGGTKDSAQAASSDIHEFKLSTIVQTSHTWVAAAEKFKEELETRTNGRMQVEIYPASQLGPEADVIQLMSVGAVDFGFITNAYLASRVDSLNAWFMPFLFDGIEDAARMRDSEISRKLLDTLEEQQITGLDWLFTGSHSILMKQGVMDSPEAFVGKQIRAPGSVVINDFYQQLGASPLPMPVSEVYTSLQTGVIDGINASVDSIFTEKFHEVADDFTLLNQFAFNAAVVMSTATLEKLSEEDKEIVLEAMRVAIDYGNEVAIKKDYEGLEELRQQIKVHELDDFEAFSDVRDSIYNKYSEKDPLIKELIEEAQKQ
ncbi:TRAP transporter substrate-binding protein [Halalkalibacterium ligniniphilum]|uniref:TRAP transporter substrate-binding protein n=1 Tax=Halalkalibacterium ligniniphilum TaxID=1134413 RepID=UPI0004781603|nr:TRAP transporter substrate-binding protein [Halalkalibacterium ligniniphilum]